MKTVFTSMAVCAALLAGCVDPKAEPWIETHDHSDSVWLMSTCDLFPDLYGHGKTIGGIKSCAIGNGYNIPKMP